MKKKTFNEQELLKGLNAEMSHADELAKLLPKELTPLERLKGSVLRYDRPTDPVWEDSFDSDEDVAENFPEDRNQPPNDRE